MEKGVPIWAKAAPIAGAGLGMIFAYKRGGGLRYFTFAAAGFIVGGAVYMLATGKNLRDIISGFQSDSGDGAENVNKLKYILDNTKLEQGELNKETLREYLASLSNKDLDLVYNMTRFSVEVKEAPKNDEELLAKLKEYGISKEDLDNFRKNILPEMIKYGSVKAKVKQNNK